MAGIAIIGGTGLTSLTDLEITGREIMQSPYGEPSGPLTRGKLMGKEVLFLPRHGYGHTIPPHKVNYRANIAVLKEAGAEKIIAVNAVGGIAADMQPGKLVIPDQIIDYTYSRLHTYFEDGLDDVVHIDFTHPYCESLREQIITVANNKGIEVLTRATYAATQGPRLETTAEIDRLDRDGCHLVGMTGMPEAALARELELCYASISVVANMAAGRGAGEITMEEIEANLVSGMKQVRNLLEQVIPVL
ncbi:MAG: S-methyl-5'-thioinosine phosphorylase [Gammaproteobacteria bacterium]|nr:S-methyl-5'-thioinosine phosphorylase [Gammaproteobacteria bacterium]MDH5652621.1 S-methyl-5'-thioinosine phosphorylase [Gammaproteobacteria bacterium]